MNTIETLRQNVDLVITPPVWVPLAAGPNTVRNKFAEFLHKTLASEATSWSAPAMLALCWSEAMLPTNGMRSMASHGKGGSTAPALQGAATASLTASQKKSRTVLGWSASATGEHGQQAARGTRKSRSWCVFPVAIVDPKFDLAGIPQYSCNQETGTMEKTSSQEKNEAMPPCHLSLLK